MNSKLEVVRINEDVIATSGVCNHITTKHIHISNYNNQSDYLSYNIYNYDGSKLVNTSFDWRSPTNLAQMGVTSSGWYYEDSTGHYTKCDDQDATAHPIANN